MRLLWGFLAGTFCGSAALVVWVEWAELGDYVRDHRKTYEVR